MRLARTAPAVPQNPNALPGPIDSHYLRFSATLGSHINSDGALPVSISRDIGSVVRRSLGGKDLSGHRKSGFTRQRCLVLCFVVEPRPRDSQRTALSKPVNLGEVLKGKFTCLN